MLIATLQEQRNKLMTDAGTILRSDSPSTEQLAQADTMLAEATALEQRISKLKQIEAHDEAQRAFQPAERPTADQSATADRSKQIDALRSYLRNPQDASEFRDILTTTTSGGAVIPQLMYPELITALREFVPVLDVVDHLTTDTGAPMKHSLTNYTNTVLPVVTEGSVFPEIDPNFGTAISSVDKLGGIVKISAEQLEDSSFDLPTWLRQQWQNVYGVSLESYVTNGNGSHITGLLATAGNGNTSAVSGAIAYPDVAGLFGSLTAAYARNGKFMMSTATRAALMGLVASTGTPIFDPNPAGNPFSSIFGADVIINDSMPALAAGNKAILFGDFKRGYLLRTDGPVTIKRLDERYADTDEVGFIIRTRVGGITKNAGIAPYVALTVHA